MFARVGIEGVDRVAEGAGVLDVLPCDGGERGTQRSDGSVDRSDEYGLAVELKPRGKKAQSQYLEYCDLYRP